MANNNGSGLVKWILILGVLAVLGGGAWYFFGKRGADAPQYQTTTVTRGDIVQAVTATGTLNPVVNVTVGSQVSGNIARLFVDYNSQVKSNQVVAELDPSLFQASVAQAQGDLANATANMELMQIQAKRADELSKAKLIADSDHDTATANLHQAAAMVQIKQAALSNAQVNLAHCTIYAPVDGVVISRNVDVGQTVAASLSAPTIFVIAGDLAKMQIDANVSEADVGTVEEGQPVSFTVDAFPSRTFPGQVTQIRNSPTTVQNVVTYDTVIGVSNKDLKLRPGMTANASVITAKRDSVLKIPNAAFRFKPPEPSTNKSFLARMMGGVETKTAPTNAAPAVKADGTNQVAAAGGEAPLTGNEPPEELGRRVREMRARGDEVPPDIMAKVRELYKSGVLQRPAGGGNGGSGGGGGSHSSQPSTRTVYLLPAKTSDNDTPTPQAVRIKVGISDGATTEVIDGLKEGDVVITGLKYSGSAPAPAAGASPFGGGGGGGGGRRF